METFDDINDYYKGKVPYQAMRDFSEAGFHEAPELSIVDHLARIGQLIWQFRVLYKSPCYVVSTCVEREG